MTIDIFLCKDILDGIVQAKLGAIRYDEDTAADVISRTCSRESAILPHSIARRSNASLLPTRQYRSNILIVEINN
ncbi:hypothetical protein ANCCEY_09946 [Ancylostoma ceylanicum]|uniref:Uncharacterized protein n=1 Tax=Ancylostoma ceylanicum TaxID=53326 RepID=A0A0D6LTJ8_9BILA|nr:hypothetical protein ANCCEY_09946 [Ancylostoma ceylanicum]